MLSLKLKQMEVDKTPIEGLLVIKPKIFYDNRGCFFESWNTASFKKIGIDYNFVQDNQSVSNKGVLRGLHFQNPPFAQGKLVRVLRGSVLDVAVDIRKKSKTYGQHFSIKLSEENSAMFWIPPGFAHGFISLEDNTIFSYKCTQFYNQSYEGSLNWSDKKLDIDWKVNNPIVSEKDNLGVCFSDFTSLF